MNTRTLRLLEDHATATFKTKVAVSDRLYERFAGFLDAFRHGAMTSGYHLRTSTGSVVDATSQCKRQYGNIGMKLTERKFTVRRWKDIFESSID